MKGSGPGFGEHVNNRVEKASKTLGIRSRGNGRRILQKGGEGKRSPKKRGRGKEKVAVKREGQLTLRSGKESPT